MKYNSIVYDLTFENIDSSNDELLNKHFNKVSELLCDYSKLLPLPTQLIFSALSEEGKNRLIVSPNVAETLYLLQDNIDLLLQLEKFILSEGGREKICQSPLGYTSMSDFSFVKEYIPIELNCGILLDYNGLFHTHETRYTYKEASKFKNILEKALLYIKEGNAVAYNFVLENTIMISLFKDSERYQTNFSSDIGIGKIHSLNFERISNDLLEVVDFIIHESIHNYIHLVEESRGTFFDWDKTNIEKGTQMAISPWTGNKICPHSYTHAICVWFGLVAFWKSVAVDKGTRELEMYNKSKIGFVKNDILSGIRSIVDAVEPDCFKLVEKLSLNLKDKYAA